MGNHHRRHPDLAHPGEATSGGEVRLGTMRIINDTYAWILAHVAHEAEECLEYPFAKPNGYGSASRHGKSIYAHRLMCELAYGPAPTPQHYATHSCGNGHNGCVNPLHLKWATPSENQLDRREHGTAATWGGVGKLTLAQKLEIKALAGTVTQEELAKRFNVRRSTISKVIIRKSWEKTPEARFYGHHKMNYFTPEEDAQIIKLASEGKLFTQIARIIGREPGSVCTRAKKIGAQKNYKPWPKGFNTKTMPLT